MPHEIKIYKVYIHFSAKFNPPLFDIFNKVIDRSLRCDSLMIVICGSTASSHPNMIDADNSEILNQSLVHMVVNSTRCSISVGEDQDRFLTKLFDCQHVDSLAILFITDTYQFFSDLLFGNI